MTTNEIETRRIDMYLNLVDENGDRRIECRECGARICDGSEEWRENVPIRKREISGRLEEFGIWVKEREADEQIELHERYCPNCAIQLGAQVTVAGEDRPLQVDPDFL